MQLVTRQTLTSWVLAVLFSAAFPAAWAQAAAAGQSTERAAPRPQDLEPGVNTSATAGAAATMESTGNAATPDGASAAPAAAGAPGKASSAARAKKGDSTPTSTDSAAKPKSKAQDRIELDATQITGNRELPKVLYIVPWKRSDLGDLVGRPVNSLLDEVLTPVDRDVFKRQNRYYDALKPDAGKQAVAPMQGAGANH